MTLRRSSNAWLGSWPQASRKYAPAANPRKDPGQAALRTRPCRHNRRSVAAPVVTQGALHQPAPGARWAGDRPRRNGLGLRRGALADRPSRCVPRSRSRKGRRFVRRGGRRKPTSQRSSIGQASVFRRKSVPMAGRGPLWRGPWRRGWDSNPRYPQGHNGFRDRPNRPLWHLSARGFAASRPRSAGAADRMSAGL